MWSNVELNASDHLVSLWDDYYGFADTPLFLWFTILTSIFYTGRYPTWTVETDDMLNRAAFMTFENSVA